MTTPREIAERMLQTSERATSQYPFDPVPDETHQDYVCPLCDGEGYVEGSTWHTQKAASIQAFGIGDDLETMEQFVSEANPENIRAVIQAAQAMAEALKGELWCRSEPGGDKCQCAGCIALKQWEGG